MTELAAPNFSLDGRIRPRPAVAALASLQVGQSAAIAALVAPPELTLQMMEMGLVKGRSITLLRKAPFGGPVAIELDGSILSLRRDEAELVLVSGDGSTASDSDQDGTQTR